MTRLRTISTGSLLIALLFALSGCKWVVSTVNKNIVTCVWDDDTNLTKTVNLEPFAASFLQAGTDCPEGDK